MMEEATDINREAYHIEVSVKDIDILQYLFSEIEDVDSENKSDKDDSSDDDSDSDEEFF